MLHTALARFALALSLAGLLAAFARPNASLAQSKQPHLARSAGSGGLGRFVPGYWGIVTTVVGNPTNEPIDVITAAHFEGDPHRQYGRQLWVPPRTRRTSYYSVFAPSDLAPDKARAQVKTLLVEEGRTGETIIPTRTGEMLHSDIVTVLHEPCRTAVIVDTEDREVRELVWAMRTSRELTTEVAGLLGDPYPPSREALASIDQLVVASDALLADRLATQAVRQWLFDGGRLWLLLDRVSPDTVNSLLGERAQFEVIDRFDLSQLQIQDARSRNNPRHGDLREFEEPVAMVRVLARDVEVLYTVEGWPAAMQLDAGRGQVLITTLGPRAWYRDPTPDDKQPKESSRRSRFVATAPLEFMGAEFLVATIPPALPPAQLEAAVRSRIGYEVVPRSSVATVLAGFCLLLLVSGVLLARRKQLELLGIVGPVLALGCAGLLAGLGAASRGAVPATVVTSQFVETSPDVPDVRVHGALAAYTQSTSAEPLAATRGGMFQFDLEHQTAQQRRMVWTDVDRWHWQNVTLPQGIHVAPLTYSTSSSASPVLATATFGPQGLTGELQLGPLKHPQDALLVTAAGERRKSPKAGHENGRRMAARLSADGGFESRASDVLAPGQYLGDATLDDDQRRRQQVLANLLQASNSPYPLRPTLLVWCDALDTGFRINPIAQQRGEALVAIPLVLQRPPAGTRVVVPAPFLPYDSVPLPGSIATSASFDNLDKAWIGPLTEGSRTLLRYQLPEAVLPLRVEQAQVEMDIKAPGRKIQLRSYAGDKAIELAQEQSPVGTLSYRIDRPEALELDAEGGWRLEIDVGGIAGATEKGISEIGWQIGDVRLEISGTTQPRTQVAEQVP